MIGVLDDIPFQVTGQKMLTWQDAGRDSEPRWAEHDVYAGLPLSEFLGPGLDTIRLSIFLDSAMGVIPRDEIRRLREKESTGAVLQYTIGGNLVGDFTLRGISERWTLIDAQGVLRQARVNLTLRRYA